MPARKLPGLIGGLPLLVLLLDLTIPRGWSIPLLYFPCVLLTYWLPAPRAPVLIASLCSALLVAGFPFGSDILPWQMIAVNRLTTIILLWMTAFLILRSRQVERDDDLLKTRLEHQRQELQLILDAVPAIIFYKDTQHRIIQVNESHARSLGLTKEQIQGRTDEDLDSPYAEQYRQADDYVMKNGVPIRGLVEPLFTQSGIRWLQTDKIPIRNLQGDVIGLVGVAMDITQFKQTEDRLRDSEQSLALAQSIASMGSWTLELGALQDSDPLHWSDQVYRIFGYEPGQIEASNENFFKAVHPDDRPRIRAAIAACIRDGQRYQIDHRIYLPDGTERIVHEESDVTHDPHSGKPIRMTGTIQDITERKWSERLLAQQRLILERIAGGTPLTDILTSLVMLYENQFPGSLCSVLLLDHEQRLRLGAAPSLPAAYNQAIDGVAIGPSVGSCGTAAYRRETVIVEEIATNRLWEGYQELAEAHQLRSCWSTPILGAQGEVLGTFALYSRQPQHPTPREVSLIEGACHIAGIAIQRTRADEARQAAENLFRNLVESTLVGIHILQDDKFAYVNPKFAEIFGYAAEEILAFGSLTEIAVKEDREMISAQVRQRLNNDVPRAQYEFRGLRKDGRVIDIEVRGSRTELHGRPAVIGSLIDITDRKLADAALKESEARYRALVENAPTGVFVNIDDRFAYVNPALCQLLGAESKDQLLGEPIFKRIHPDLNTIVRERIEHLLQQGDIVPLMDQRYLRLDGSEVEVQTLAAPFVLQGRRAALVMVNDVTERKTMERTLKQTTERMQLLSRQLLRAQEAERAHVARELHDEIGQVLTAIGFHLHSLINVCGPEHRAQFEEDISLVDGAVQQIRDLSLNLRPPTLDVLGLEATLRAYLKDQARRTGLVVHISGHLESRLTPELEIICYRVVQTTLTNVVRHARASQVWVELQHGEQILKLTIRDDGIGFDTDAVWQQAKQGRSFGLVGVRERVELVGGQLSVVSAAGAGTTIHVQFPLNSFEPLACNGE